MIEFIVPAVTGAVGTGIGWALTVEKRLTRHETLLDKVDELVTMLIEERKGGNAENQGGGGTLQINDPHRSSGERRTDFTLPQRGSYHVRD